MSGDYSRQRFDPNNDFTGVLQQQGRVQLDADWNELINILDRRLRAVTTDIIGRGVVPNETPAGFQIQLAGGVLTIGRGRIYVDGLLAENHGKAPLEFDPVLAEQRGTLPVPYNEQPYLPNASAVAPAPQEGGPHLVYVDVWEREVTSLEDPDLIEKAVGVDTTARLQIVWQVKVLPNVGAGVTCDMPVQVWTDLIAPSDGRLSTAAVGVPAETDPCLIPPSGGYRGLENRLYRLEIHDGGLFGAATFKWSGDNASVTTNVTMIPALDTLKVTRVGRDSVMRFNVGDWIEITDDWLEFARQPGVNPQLAGVMAQIKNVDDATQIITLAGPLPVNVFQTDLQGNTDPTRNTRIRQWHQSGQVRDTNGNLLVDLNAPGSKGVIPVPVPGTSIILEDGVQVTFDTSTNGTYHIADYWIFAARTADASVESLQQAPPRGIHHHFYRLAMVTFPSTATDCRALWPPAFGDAGCDCSVCVSANSHNSGTLTIQSAINQVAGKGGGKVCLGPGIYNITETVKIGGPNAIEISGHGLPSLAAGTGLSNQNPIMQIEQAMDVAVGDIAFVGPAATLDQPSIPGLVVNNSFFVRINRCVFSGFTPPSAAGAGPGTPQDTLSPAIGIVGIVWGMAIRDNLFTNVKVGIGTVPEDSPIVLAYSSMQNNEMMCSIAGVALSQSESSFQEVSFTDNSVSSAIGFQLHGSGLDVAIERNSFVVAASPPISTRVGHENAAISCSASQTRISNNQIFGDIQNPGPDGIVLGRIVLGGTSIDGTQVVGNRIAGLSGAGILVRSLTYLLETIISQNQLLNLGGAGIKMETGSFAQDLNITGNSLANVGLAPNATLDLVGIQLSSPCFNVNISENVIEVVGPDTQSSASRAGIVLNEGGDVRVAGNRIVDIGRQGLVDFSPGIFLGSIVGRAEIVDNEVRRASIPQPNSTDQSPWSALFIGAVIGVVNVRGNLLESFGGQPTAILLSAQSCIFNDNQCFLDNIASQPSGSQPLIAVLLAKAIIASNNYLKGPKSEANQSMFLADQVPFTVLGNISSGSIMVGPIKLQPPWAPLNATNAAI